MEQGTNETVRRRDLLAMISRGNHKSAQTQENENSIEKYYSKEIDDGWMVPITIDCLKKIKGSGIIKLVVSNQLLI